MAELDREMLQDFVVEVNDNLEELEPNLLVLEADPSNRSLINDCFRNMHTIKGAAGYMGFSRISELAHGVEDLFHRIREGELEIDPDLMTLVFKAVDRIRALLSEVEESGEEKSEVDDLLAQLRSAGAADKGAEPAQEGGVEREAAPAGDGEEPEPEPEPMDEDQELMEIFTEEITSLYQQLRGLVSAGGVDRRRVMELLDSMIRVVNYVGLDGLRARLEELKGRLEELGEDPEALERIILEIGSLLEREVEGFSMEQGREEAGSGPSEDDPELYSIFVEFVRENATPLTRIPSTPDRGWLERCEEVVGRLKASAHYMDYPDVVAVFEEYGERLAELLSGGGEGFDPQRLKALWERLQSLIPELADLPAEIVEQTQEEGGEVQELDQMIDELFESEDTWAAFEGAQGAEEGGAPPPPEVVTLEELPEGLEGLDQVEERLDGLLAQAGGLEEAGEAVGPQAPRQEPVPGREGPPREAARPGEKRRERGPAQTVRMDLEQVEELLRDVGELVVVRAGISQAAEQMREIYRHWMDRRLFDAREMRPYKELMLRMAEHATTLSRVVHGLQDRVMRMRMLPVSTLFNRYPRLVRDLARKLQKEVALEIYGTETTLDKRLIEEMVDPMLHILRNAVDHGIEAPEARERMGKPRRGTIALTAGQEGNFVVLTVSDDGRGLDREAIIRRAVSLGLVRREEAQTLPDHKVWELIFLPGISTAQEISETSGRGVGMDVVKRNVERVGGTIKVYSTAGKGTTIEIRIPLTLAIIPALVTRVGRQAMAIPLPSVQETIRVFAHEISTVEGFEIISLRQRTLPLIRLAKVFRGTGSPPDPRKLFVVIIRQGDVEVGLAVDGLMGQQEVVIKPLAEYLTDQPGFSGATILGDGSIALIIDIPVMLEKAKEFISRQQEFLERSAMSAPGEGPLIQ